MENLLKIGRTQPLIAFYFQLFLDELHKKTWQKCWKDNLMTFDLRRFWISCLGHLVFIASTFKLIGFPILRYWGYLMKVIPINAPCVLNLISPFSFLILRFVMVLLWFFVSFRIFFPDNTRVRIFFCRAKREFFSSKFQH
jgi:hypothetical protein